MAKAYGAFSMQGADYGLENTASSIALCLWVPVRQLRTGDGEAQYNTFIIEGNPCYCIRKKK